MTCKDCIHSEVCHLRGNVPSDYADKCGYSHFEKDLERPHGKWIKEDKPWGGFGDRVLVLTCSECGESFVYHGNNPKFCSECGAKMEEDNE